jgi:hypothetical protein
MASFVDVPDIGSDFLVLMACEHRLSSGDAANCLHQIERLAQESPYDGVRASASEMLRRHREDHPQRPE